MRYQDSFQWVYRTFFISLLLAGCGGGGGGGSKSQPSDNFSISSTQLNFSADIDASTPVSQVVTGTVTGINTSVRVDIVIDGTAVESADFSFVGANGGSLSVQVKGPDTLGVGQHNDQIKVYVCTDLTDCVNSPTQVSGSPKTIAVSYNVTATPTLRYVAPIIGQPDTAGEIILRGVGFSLLSSPGVYFESISALSVDVINDTEIRATFPALSEGDYQVNVSDLSGNIATNAILHVMTEPTLGYAFVASTGAKTRVIYDAVRDAMYVGNMDTGDLIRYAHSVSAMSEPVWTPTSLAIADIKDIALLPDGNTLLVLSDKSVVHVDLDTFTTAGTFPSPLFGSASFLRQIGIANNGIGFVAPGINGFGSSFVYKYNARKYTFILADSATVSQGTVGVSGDGSKILIGSRESNTSFNAVYQYNATDDGSLTTLSMNETANALPMDRTGNTVVLGMQNSLNDQRRVYRNESLLGAIPGSGANNINFSSALSPDGTRLYSYSPQADVVNIYDLNTDDGVGGFNEAAGSPVSVTDSAGTDLALTMGMTPFGGTLFISGNAGVVVQPLP